jgi:hypothetical protein
MNAPLDLIDVERRTLLARIAELERESPRAAIVIEERVPEPLDRAIRDLLARIERRSDVGADTRLAVEAVRQELHAATSTTSKETER